MSESTTTTTTGAAAAPSTAAIRDFELFLNQSLNNDISAEINDILRNANPKLSNSLLSSHTLTDSHTPRFREKEASDRLRRLYTTQAAQLQPQPTQQQQQQQPTRHALPFHQSLDNSDSISIFNNGHDPLPAFLSATTKTSTRSPPVATTVSSRDDINLDSLVSKIADMQFQIDNLIQTNKRNLSESESVGKPHTPPPSRTKHSSLSSLPSKNTITATSKFNDIYKELAMLKSALKQQQHQQQQINKDVPIHLKSYVKKEIRKNNEWLVETVVGPEIRRELHRMDLKFHQRLDDTVGDLNNNHITAGGRGGGGGRGQLHERESKYQKLLNNDDEQEDQESCSIEWQEAINNDTDPHLVRSTAKSQNSNYSVKSQKLYSSAEQELNDLMRFVKADVDGRRTYGTSRDPIVQNGGNEDYRGRKNGMRAFHSHRTDSSGSRGAGTSSSGRGGGGGKKIPLKYSSYSQPTLSSRLKTKHTPAVWK
ncbi:hypothetical protein HK100_002237 [Physocladia obscura]|uniref:Uncharacterized protein n=1 Tax=Physocladia obscura TaxID=109957 RepID=A0AAD5SW14_9FUNG|nr:hypothetical protein HK100_002237 [Physocladia obscura]